MLSAIGVIGLFISLFAFIKGSIKTIRIQNRKQAALLFIISFVVMLVGAPSVEETASNTVDNEKKTENVSVKVDPVEFKGTMNMTAEKGKITVSVESNVPDGGLFEIAVMNPDFDVLSDFVPIENGKIIKEFTVPDKWGPANVSSIAMFRFNLEEHPQPDHIKAIYGENGEKMQGELRQSNNLNGFNGNIKSVATAYPDEATLRTERTKLFGEAIQEIINLSNGVIVEIKPMDKNWNLVDVVVSDSWYYSKDYEKERFAEQVSQTISTLVLNAEMTDSSTVMVYFYDTYGSELASPKLLGGYKINK